MGDSRLEGTSGAILRRLKRSGSASIPEVARSLELSPESIRAHVRALADDGLLEDVGARSEGRGRPERLYALTRGAEALFPRRESELLRELTTFLRQTGREGVLTEFLDGFANRRRTAALERLGGLKGRRRLDEVARILTEEGYMAEIRDDGDGAPPRLRLCHCPLRELVDVTKAPCKAELSFVRDLVGGSMARVEYIPDGDTACAYSVQEKGA